MKKKIPANDQAVRASADRQGQHGRELLAPGTVVMMQPASLPAPAEKPAQMAIGNNASKGTIIKSSKSNLSWIVEEVNTGKVTSYLLAPMDSIENDIYIEVDADNEDYYAVTVSNESMEIVPIKKDEPVKKRKQDFSERINREDKDSKINKKDLSETISENKSNDNLVVKQEDEYAEERERWMKESGTVKLDENDISDLRKIYAPVNEDENGTEKPLNTKGLEKKLNTALKQWLNNEMYNVKILQNSKLSLEMPRVKNIASVAFDCIKEYYGNLIKIAAPSKGNIAQQKDFDPASENSLKTQNSRIDNATIEQLKEFALQSAWYAISTENIQELLMKYNFNPSRKEDQEFITPIIKKFAENEANRKKLNEVKKMWPAEEDQETGITYLQLKLRKMDNKMDDKTFMNYEYWKTFQMMIHELIHSCAHIRMQEAAAMLLGSERNIVVEGFCEFFAQKIWLDIRAKLPKNEKLQKAVTGKYDKNIIPKDIPEVDRYPSIEDAKNIIKKICKNHDSEKAGEQNLTAAFFLGEVELVGLKPPPEEEN